MRVGAGYDSPLALGVVRSRGERTAHHLTLLNPTLSTARQSAYEWEAAAYIGS